MKRFFFTQKYKHLGAENQKIQKKNCEKSVEKKY